MTSIVFVACVEPGPLEAQAVLLCRSIRAFAGRHRGARVLALQPLRGGDLQAGTIEALELARAEFRRVSLGDEFPHYPIANKAFAAAWAEEHATDEIVVFVDSDSFFAREPAALELTAGAGAAVRPANTKNVGTSGDGDPHEAFWRALCARFGIRSLPRVRATLTGEEMDGYWNAGLVAARRGLGLMLRWREILTDLMRAGTVPPDGNLNHLDQVALALALAPAAVDVLDPRHNYPLPQRHRMSPELAALPLEELVHVHYFHKLHLPGYLDTLDPPLTRCPVAAWLRDHLPLEPVSHGSAPRPVYRVG